jgi:hypothetical protein
MLTVIVIPILIEFSPETFLQIILELWLEIENDIITQNVVNTDTDKTDKNNVKTN